MMDYLNDVDRAYDVLMEYGVATEDEISLVTSIIGYNLTSLESILYSRTGYRSFEQYLEE